MKTLLGNIVDIKTGVYDKPNITGNAIYLQANMFNAFGELHNGIMPNVTIDRNHNKHLLAKGDVLFVAKGINNFALEYNASIGLAIASSTFLILKPMRRNTEVLPGYLAWYLNHPRTQAILKSQARGSSMPSISKQTLEELEILLPSLQRQQQILEIQQLRNQEKQIVQRLEILKEQLVQSQLLLAAQL